MDPISNKIVMNEKLNQIDSRSIAGAVGLEFALIATVFFFFLIGTCHLAIHLVVWGIVEKGCHNGVALAVKMPGLEAAVDDQDYLDAVEEIEEVARNYPLSTGLVDAASLRIRLIRPGEAGHPTLNEQENLGNYGMGFLMATEPIVLQCSVQPRISIPLLGINTIAAVAVGYR